MENDGFGSPRPSSTSHVTQCIRCSFCFFFLWNSIALLGASSQAICPDICFLCGWHQDAGLVWQGGLKQLTAPFSPCLVVNRLKKLLPERHVGVIRGWVWQLQAGRYRPQIQGSKQVFCGVPCARTIVSIPSNITVNTMMHW